MPPYQFRETSLPGSILCFVYPIIVHGNAALGKRYFYRNLPRAGSGAPEKPFVIYNASARHFLAIFPDRHPPEQIIKTVQIHNRPFPWLKDIENYAIIADTPHVIFISERQMQIR